MMYSLGDVKHLHIELSSLCNAECPLCPRNFHGFPYNDGYEERNLTLNEIKKILKPDFLRQLTEIDINGNFGDFVMNPESIDIIEYFRECSNRLVISIGTNAGARNKEFWTKLAELDCQVLFCIDGLEDTHSLYRKNTAYQTVIKNAVTFINHGGNACWKMIDFAHNKHQQLAAKNLSKELKFKKFLLVNHGRDAAPVFSKDGQLTHVIGSPKEINFQKLYQLRTTSEVLLEDITPGRVVSKIKCEVQKRKSLYISSTGDVYPCCFLGFNPKKYGKGIYHQAANAQFKDWVQENNALTWDLEHCIQWFNRIVESWNLPDFESGRLVICNDVCGIKN